MYLNTTTEHPNLVPGSPIPVPAAFTPLLAAPTEVGYHAVYANWTYQFAAIDPPATQYTIRRRSSVGRPGNENFASLKLGGPMNPFALFDTPVPSVGIWSEEGATPCSRTQEDRHSALQARRSANC